MAFRELILACRIFRLVILQVALLTKIDLIQKLQESRPLTVHLFDEIPRILPDGVYLTKIIQTGTDLIFEGKSPSNARVSDFMKAIEASPWLQNLA